MLYVFFVNTGDMMTFDMNLALESVSSLKEAISLKSNIPSDKQVLLINGGESLNGDAKVYSYNAAGTDTSPIYLFSKQALEGPFEHAGYEIPADYLTDFDMKERLQSCMSMEPALNTVVSRVELAKEMHEIATQLVNICERVIHDQHLQHQGWRAVVANLEDITASLVDGVNYLKSIFSQYLEKRESHIKLLEEFTNDLQLLSTIPVLKKLIESKESFNDELPDSITLLQWISQKDTKCTLEQVLQMAQQSVEQFNENALDDISQEANEVIKHVNKPQAKEIGGLEERLYGLEKLMQQARKLAADQNDVWQTLYQNQQRVLNIRDPSILPDLCKNHARQLEHMGSHHQQLREIRRKCVTAKWELSKNLHARLTWIVYIEKKLMDAREKVFIYGENLRRLRRHLEVIEQVHLAPKVYIESVIEVVRRREFSTNYLKWSSSLSNHASSVYKEEVDSRTKFAELYANHFLNGLFPGMRDIPPPFATEPPDEFDIQLPQLNEEDLTLLRNALPDLVSAMQIPSRVPFKYLILTSSSTLDPTKNSAASTKQISSDDTEDTEEFENVSNEISKLNRGSLTDSPLAIRKCTEIVASGVDRTTSPDGFLSTDYFMDESMTSPGATTATGAAVINVKCEASTSTSFNIDELLTTVENLKKDLSEKDAQCANSNAELNVSRTRLKEKLDVLKDVFSSITDHIADQRKYTEMVRGDAQSLKKDLESLLKDVNNTMVQKLQEKNQIIDEMKDSLAKKDEEMECNRELNQKALLELETKFEEEKVRLNEEAEKAKQLAIQSVKDEYELKLKQAKEGFDAKLKEELDGIRSRFKLAMSASIACERVPTPTSLEPVTEASEEVSIERQLMLLRKELKQKQEEVNELKSVIEAQSKLSSESAEKHTNPNLVTINSSSLVSRLNEIKVAVAKFKRNLHEEEELQAFESIERLLEDNFEAAQSIYVSAPETKEHVIKELEMALKDKNMQIVKLRENLIDISMNASTFANSDRISVLSCEPGDIVLLCYDDRYKSYIIFSLLPTLHILHPDSIDRLGLNSGSNETPRSWTLAEVIDKEFCQAKKAKNRYNVPLNTRFYRVHAKSWYRADIILKKGSSCEGTSPSGDGEGTASSVAHTVAGDDPADVKKVPSPSTTSTGRIGSSMTQVDKEARFDDDQ